MDKIKTISAAILIDSLEEKQDYISTFDGVVVEKETGVVFFKENAPKRALYKFSQELVQNYISKIEGKIKDNIRTGDTVHEYEDCLPNCDVSFKYSFETYENTTTSADFLTPDDVELIIDNFEFSEINVTLENGELIKIL